MFFSNLNIRDNIYTNRTFNDFSNHITMNFWWQRNFSKQKTRANKQVNKRFGLVGRLVFFKGFLQGMSDILI